MSSDFPDDDETDETDPGTDGTAGSQPQSDGVGEETAETDSVDPETITSWLFSGGTTPWLVFGADYDLGTPTHPAIEICYTKLGSGDIIIYHPEREDDTSLIQSDTYVSVTANR